jgi:S-methylmethionine-dependent homocysteine/selenocysteine methylase
MPSCTPERELPASAYRRIEGLLAEGRCVILDGGVATELQRLRPLAGQKGPEPELWGTWALFRATEAASEVHRRYVEAGCDVVSTDTWSLLATPERRWSEAAGLGVRLARHAVAEGEREAECAVAFALSGEALRGQRPETLALLARALEEEPPDLILLETLSLLRDDLYSWVERLLETGFPLWLSFRRCRYGVCGVYGQHWGPPEGDLFGRAARRFEELGVGALLINCLPVSHVPGMVHWLRDFTGLPLGVYPNLGHLLGATWHFDERIGPDDYAQLALAWRAEGAQIVGGCCGVTPEHMEAAARALADTRPGRLASAPAPPPTTEIRPEAPPWIDREGRSLFPLPFPDLAVDEGVFVPTQGSFLVWKHLFREGLGKGQSCLDVGCGCGLLAVQLALNDAAHVHAIDIDGRAVANTLANASRNGVSERVTGGEVDIYQWEPEDRYDLVAASLYQMPVDPFEEPTGHRPLDYWGRTLLDHFLGLLPSLLTTEGSAYVMHLSIIGQAETARIVAERGLESRVVDFSFYPFGPVTRRNSAQIARVEERSDAYHLRIREEDVMVAYLLEVRLKES